MDFLFSLSIRLFCSLLLIVALSGFGLEQQLRYRVNLTALCWATHAEKGLTAKHKVRRIMPSLFELAKVTAKHFPTKILI